MARVLVLVVVAGCLPDMPIGTWDMPGALAQPVSEHAHLAYWSAQVTSATDAWNAALAAQGCAIPFMVGHSGREVRLVATADWRDDPKYVGVTVSDHISIRDTRDEGRDTLPSLVHELGHAIGLGHRGGESVMTVPVGDLAMPTEVDVDAASDLLGCR